MATEDDLAKQIISNAMCEKARQFTYRLINISDPSGGGTAVAIKLGNHFFLATVKHVIENNDEIKVIVRHPPVNEVSEFVARHFKDDSDVGLLEIKQSDSNYFEFATSSHILQNLDKEKEHPVLVCGYPGEYIQTIKTLNLNNENQLRIVGCNPFTFVSVILPLSEWPEDKYDNPFDVESDLFVDFHPEHKLRRVGPNNSGILSPLIESTPPQPYGMSGGGIWLAQVTVKDGIHKADVRLVGLQTAKRNGFLRGILIRNWLDLVCNKYPYLTDLN